MVSSEDSSSNIVVNDSLVKLNGDSEKAIKGDTAKIELENNNQRLENIITALEQWTPVPSDGGAALKLLITAALQASPPAANYSDILSDKSKT